HRQGASHRSGHSASSAGRNRAARRSKKAVPLFLTGRTVEHVPLLTKAIDWPSGFLETHHTSDLWLMIVLSILAAEALSFLSFSSSPLVLGVFEAFPPHQSAAVLLLFWSLCGDTSSRIGCKQAR